MYSFLLNNTHTNRKARKENIHICCYPSENNLSDGKILVITLLLSCFNLSLAWGKLFHCDSEVGAIEPKEIVNDLINLEACVFSYENQLHLVWFVQGIR